MKLEVTLNDQGAVLRLNDPPRNMLTPEMLDGTLEALEQFRAAGSPVLLLASRGKHFSTGYPIDAIPENIFHADASVRDRDPFQRVMNELARYESPIVASIQGDAYGGAIELLSCADIRIGVEGSRFALPSVRLGLVYSHSGMRRLASRLGAALTREMLLTGSPITARRAFEEGFLNRLVPQEKIEKETQSVLKEIDKGTDLALRGTRRLLNLLDESESLPPEILDEVASIRHEAYCSEESRLAREEFGKKKR